MCFIISQLCLRISSRIFSRGSTNLWWCPRNRKKKLSWRSKIYPGRRWIFVNQGNGLASLTYRNIMHGFARHEIC